MPGSARGGHPCDFKIKLLNAILDSFSLLRATGSLSVSNIRSLRRTSRHLLPHRRHGTGRAESRTGWDAQDAKGNTVGKPMSVASSGRTSVQVARAAIAAAAVVNMQVTSVEQLAARLGEKRYSSIASMPPRFRSGSMHEGGLSCLGLSLGTHWHSLGSLGLSLGTH